ncbi:hypothetical protein [Salipiger thiooxidans]|uniref:hypothetical protein n=1 Tax=Salipiger thiooxidans TaxID=282683 RepID=UPI001CFBBD0E|nr:hypothetical protein [Salipiger thiooxidans]
MNDSDWSVEVSRMLYDVGFFRLLRVPTPDHFREEGGLQQITVLPMISSVELPGQLLQELLDDLSAIAEVLQQDPAIYSGLFEAAYNANKHAYPEDYEWEFRPVARGWWATAGWNPREGCVKFLVYDQGVGIPATLPRWGGWERVRERLARSAGALLGDEASATFNDASKLIEAAIEVDRTSLDGGHGKGLQDVVAVVQGRPGAKVRILSGKGRVLYYDDHTVELKDEALHLGGTLIEWTIPVGISQEAVES